MTSNAKRCPLALALLAALGVTALPAVAQDARAASAATATSTSQRTVVGAWRTVVTPRNCQTGAQIGPAFQGMSMFNLGGTMSEFGAGSSPATRSQSQGVWQRERGWRDYSFSFMFYRFDAAGAFIGSQEVSATLELEAGGDTYTSLASVDIIDVNNNVVAHICATSIGTRYE